MKKLLSIFVLCIGALCVSSCEKSSEGYNNSQHVDLETDTESDNTHISTTIEESETMPKVDYEYRPPDSHSFFREVTSADKYFNITKIEIPNINDLEADFWYLIDRDNIIVKLFKNGPKNYGLKKYSETGIYNLKTKKYETVLPEEKSEYNIRAYNEKYIIFSDMASDLSYETLYYYDRVNKTLREFYNYSIYENGKMYSYHTNNILIKDDTIYFDDYYKNDLNEVAVKLYSYDISESKLNVLKDNAQNPLLYCNDVIYITKKNDDNKYNLISSISNNFKLDINDNIFGTNGLKTNNSSIFAVGYNTFIDANNYGYSNYALKNMITEDVIIASNDPLCDLVVTDNFVCWSDYAGTIYTNPYMYDINHDKVISFDSIEEADYHFFAYEECGIIVTYKSGNYGYYYFEYK